MKKLTTILCLVCLALLPACASSPANTASSAQAPASQAAADNAGVSSAADNAAAATGELSLPQLDPPVKGESIAVMETSMGTITFRFFPQYAPKAVENFTTLVSQGYYDGLKFHRVVNGFMIQSGDPNGDGTGGQSIWGQGFGLETTPSLRNIRGALSMANTGQANSNGSQFFVVQAKTLDAQTQSDFTSLLDKQDQKMSDGTLVGDIYPTRLLNSYIQNGGVPALDGGYTVFGQVIGGMDVVDAIAAVPVQANSQGEQSQPVSDVTITKVTMSTYDGN